MERRLQALSLAAALLLAVPAGAQAHSVVRTGQGTVSYLASDATSLNTLTVRLAGNDIEFRDPTVDGGIDPGPCRPGELNGRSEVIQVFCPRAGVELVRVDVGEREDKVTGSLPIPMQGLGGPGADQVSAGDAADILAGNEGNDTLDSGAGNDQLLGGDGDDRLLAGEGNDRIQGGAGADAVEAGGGDDSVETPDGIADTVTCGDGADTVDADTLDEVAADCETVRRTTVAAPRDGAVGADSRPPRLLVGGDTRQRVAKRRRVFVAATSTERGTIAASGFLSVGGLDLPLQTRRRAVPRAGHGVELVVRLSREALRECRRAWRRGRPVRVRLGVVATDQAGNSTRPRTFRARLVP